MLLRVRSNVGLWRVDGLADDSATVQDVLTKICATRPQVVYFAPDAAAASAEQTLDVTTSSPFSLDPAGKRLVDATMPLSQQGLRHGSMIYCRVDPTTCVDISASLLASSSAAAAAEGSAEGATTSIKPWQPPESSSTTASHMRRVIDKDGTVRLVPLTSDDLAKNALTGRDKGFRPGMLALRDMKMSWTLNDFIAMDSQFQFKIQRQPTAVCTQCSFDMATIASFQQYAQRFSFSRKRIGYLYGKFVEPTGGKKDDEDYENKKKKSFDNNNFSMNVDGDKKKELTATKVVVEAIYEPPQQVDATAAEGFVLLDDEREPVVEEIASLLGLRKVGWIVAHEARDAGFVLSAAEVIMAAELQLEAAGGIEPTPFVTVTVAVRPPPPPVATALDGDSQRQQQTPPPAGVVSVEAFQVSQQCMAMVAEEALLVHGPDPKVCRVSDTFTAIQEGKESKTVENSFFITLVPIAQHNSELLVADFPKLNRDLDDRTPSHNELKRCLQKASTAGGGGTGGGGGGWTFVDRLADFNLLIYLAQFLDVAADFPKICAAIVNRNEVPLDDGYKILIKSMAGMDGSY
jgi:nuclear protein localization protein 4 homolog